MKDYVKQILRRKDLLLYLVMSGLKAQHRNTFLGYFWWLLDPLLGVAIYYFVVGVVFGRGGTEYLANLVIGLTVWRWFQSSVSSAAKSITSRASIISQVYLPKVILPATAVVAQLVNFACGLGVATIFAVALWDVPGVTVALLPVVVIVQFLFIVAVCLPVAYISVFIRDMDNLIGHLLRIWFYASPLIWTANALPNHWRWIVTFNPMAWFLAGFRDILLYNRVPNLTALAVIGMISAAAIGVTVWFYSRYEHRIIKVL